MFRMVEMIETNYGFKTEIYVNVIRELGLRDVLN